MKRIAWIALFSGLASACGAPATAPVTAPVTSAKPVESAPPTVASGAPETPDSPGRYVPPDRADVQSALPRPVDLTLSNGMVARLVETHQSPVVAAVVIVKWKTNAKLAGTAAVFGAAIGRLKLPSGRALGEELEEIGARAWAVTDQDATYVRVSMLRDSVEPALSRVVSALRTGKLDAPALDRARDSVRRRLEGELPGEIDDRVVDAQLFPASHRYHDPPYGSKESLDKMKADDVTRFRDGALAADGISFAVAGAISKDELSAALEKAVGSWTAKAAPKPAAAPSKKGAEEIPPGIAHGVFVSETLAGTTARVTVVIPMPDGKKSDVDGALVAWGVLVERTAQRLRDVSADGRSHLDSHMRPRALGRTVHLFADVIPGASARAADAMFKAMDDVVKGDFPDRDVTYSRRARSVRAMPGDGLESLMWVLSEELASGAPPGAEIFLAPRIEAVPREDIVRAATTYFRKERASVVVEGGTKSEKEAYEKLGAGPVTFVAAPKNGAKK